MFTPITTGALLPPNIIVRPLDLASQMRGHIETSSFAKIKELGDQFWTGDSSVDVHLYYAFSLIQEGDFPQAEVVARSALSKELKPKEEELLYTNLVDALDKQQDYQGVDQAASAALQVVDTEVKPYFYDMHSRAKLALQDFQGALQIADLQLFRDREEPILERIPSLMVKVKALNGLQEYAGARDLAQETLAVLPTESGDRSFFVGQLTIAQEALRRISDELTPCMNNPEEG